MQTREVETRQQRAGSSSGREHSRHAQSALNTGSPWRSGVVGSGNNNASSRVLLTGRRQERPPRPTYVKTKELLQANDLIQVEGELELNDASCAKEIDTLLVYVRLNCCISDLHHDLKYK